MLVTLEQSTICFSLLVTLLRFTYDDSSAASPTGAEPVQDSLSRPDRSGGRSAYHSPRYVDILQFYAVQCSDPNTIQFRFTPSSDVNDKNAHLKTMNLINFFN